MLEVVSNDKGNIFLLILFYLGPNKSLFNQYYPKSVSNQGNLLILLPKNDKMLVLAKNIFLLFFLSKQWKSVTLKCIGGADF